MNYKFREAIHLLHQLINKSGQTCHNDALKTLTDPLKGYTVVGIYEDNQQPWMTFVEESEAKNPREAAIKGIEKQVKDSKQSPDNLAMIEVVEGTVKGTLGNDVYISLENLKDPKCPKKKPVYAAVQPYAKGTLVYSRDRDEIETKGQLTGSRHPCSMEECHGNRLGVRWDNGKLTYPCTSRMTFRKRIWRII